MAMRVRKYLGQHFLKNKNIARKIVEAANLNKDDVVLEVGPGRGVLTEILVQKAGKVIAVEKDKRLTDFLMDKFKGQKNLSIINDDILRLSARGGPLPDRFACDGGRGAFGGKNYKIVANIPYYITSHFLRKFLQSDFQPKLMVLMLQKEVAERIIAKPARNASHSDAGGKGKESILSISVKAYGCPAIISNVSPKEFSPPPKVNSSIILIDNISKNFFKKNKINEEKFFHLVRLGFSHKRKMLKNNLAPLLLNTGCSTYLTKAGISEKARPEDLTLENWAFLAKNLEKQL